MSFGIDVKGFPPKVDSWELPLICPKCKTRNKTTIAQFKRQETIQCKGCGAKINLIGKDGNVRRKTEKLQHSLDELERTLREFGAEFH